MAATTNKQFANSDKVFQKACELTNVKPTRRQASKYRNKKGLAFTRKATALFDLTLEQKESQK